MADTPSEAGNEPATPKRTTRRAPSDGAAKPRARRSPAKAASESAPEKVKRAAKTAVDGASDTATRAGKAVTKSARATKAKVEEVATPARTRKVAIGAAAAVGVAAGVAAAVLGRKKIVKTANEVIDTVSGTVSDFAKSAHGADTEHSSKTH